MCILQQNIHNHCANFPLSNNDSYHTKAIPSNKFTILIVVCNVFQFRTVQNVFFGKRLKHRLIISCFIQMIQYALQETCNAYSLKQFNCKSRIRITYICLFKNNRITLLWSNYPLFFISALIWLSRNHFVMEKLLILCTFSLLISRAVCNKLAKG